MRQEITLNIYKNAKCYQTSEETSQEVQLEKVELI